MSKDSAYILITPAGEQEPVQIDKLSLEKAQELVGGLVQVVPQFNKYLDQPCVVLCDEEGKLKGKDYNNRATGEWYKALGGAVDDVLVGNVVVIVGKARRSWG